MVTRRIDVSGSPELLDVAREVAESGDEVVLSAGGREMVVVSATAGTGVEGLGEAELQRRRDALLAAFGGWANFDGDRFLAYVYSARDVPIERRYWDTDVSG